MNKYVKKSLQRGLVFAGLGPIVLGIVYAILEACLADFSLGGNEVLLAIISTYAIAFVQAGASVFNEIEDWPVPKALLCHFSSIYAVYLLAYVVNSWIPFMWQVVAAFTGIFVLTYAVIWLVVYFSVRAASRRLNTRL